MGPYGGASGAGSDQKLHFAFVSISLARKRICVHSTYCLKARPPLLVAMVPSISINVVFCNTIGHPEKVGGIHRENNTLLLDSCF